jgi:DNA invertase Pin-like site-specific DNA recombinase
MSNQTETIKTESSKTESTINFPSDYEDAIRDFMSLLIDGKSENSSANNSSAGNKASSTETKEREVKMKETEPDSFAEVSCVKDHEVKDGQYHFWIKFKNCVQLELVADEDCNCEELIRKYLSKLGIKTVYAFCRVSSKSQTGINHVSLSAQEARLRATAEKMFADENKPVRVKILKITASASKAVPRALKSIGEVAREGDVIMIYRVDRLSRNIRLLSFFDELNTRGVKIYAQDEDMWFDNNMNFLQCILDANKESHAISKRVSESIKHRRERGDEHVVGPVPFGYERHREPTGRVILRKNLEEQKTIMKMKGLLSKHKRHVLVASVLNDSKVLRRGKYWSAKTVETALSKN